MRLRTQCAVALGLTLSLSQGGVAQENVQPQESPQVQMRTLQNHITCYECIDPKKLPPCLVGSEEEEKNCPYKCKKWVKKQGDVDASIRIDNDAYSYQTGLPRANWFASSAAQQVYGQGLPENDAGHPIKFHQLYSDPEKYGWVEVPKDQPKTGSLAVWPSMGGLVVRDSSAGGAKESTKANVDVLYPSDKEGGKLAETPADRLVPDEKPKYLIPRDLLHASKSPP